MTEQLLRKYSEFFTSLNVRDDDTRRKVLTQMSQLRSQHGWKLIVRDMQFLREMIEDDIFTLGSNEVVYSGKDVLILFREFLNAFIERPDQVIKLLKQEHHSEPEEEDPY